jgi:capsular exopolysaccharide synthesis family protein
VAEKIVERPEEKRERLKLLPRETAPVLVAPPNSFAEDQFRRLKTQIFLRFQKPPHFILVTSTVPQEGKTMVAFNLAMTISREFHKNSIFIEGDLRKPSVYAAKYPNSKGLSDYLSNGATLSEIVLDCDEGNFKMIMVGSASQKTSELIGSRKMEELIMSLRNFEDNLYVIIDSPPLIIGSESTQLSNMVDGIILVAMANRTPRELMRRAVKTLDPHKIIGVVFNRIEINPSSDYSAHYYSHYYRKQNDQDK